MNLLQLVSVHALLIILYFQAAQACSGGGGCQGGGGCCCCGGCRCCHRARGSKTLTAHTVSNSKRRQSLNLDPNEEFMQCCKDAQLPPACLDKCTYGTYTQHALRSMFFKLDACPIEAANEMHMCATRSLDHRRCCAANGVSTTVAGDKCLLFCSAPSENGTQLDMSYMPCYERFESMKSCFWGSAVNDFRRNQVQARPDHPF